MPDSQAIATYGQKRVMHSKQSKSKVYIERQSLLNTQTLIKKEAIRPQDIGHGALLSYDSILLCEIMSDNLDIRNKNTLWNFDTRNPCAGT